MGASVSVSLPMDELTILLGGEGERERAREREREGARESARAGTRHDQKMCFGEAPTLAASLS